MSELVPGVMVVNTHTDETSLVINGLNVPGVGGVLVQIATRVFFIDGSIIDIGTTKHALTHYITFSPEQASHITNMGYTAIGEKIK